MNIYDVIIVGAGASGLVCAGNIDTEKKVLLLDSNEEAGKKLLITGGGSCNITNSRNIKEFPVKYGCNGNRIRTILYRHNNVELEKYLSSTGVELVEREGGRLFPLSRRARDIRDAYLKEVLSHCVDIKYSSKVIEVIAIEGNSQYRYCVTADKETYYSNNVVFATGGKSYPNLGSDGKAFEVIRRLGIIVTETKPSLTPIFTEEYPFSECSGISFPAASIKMENRTSEGPVLLTHRGFSGPAVMRISEYAEAGNKLIIDFAPSVRDIPDINGVKTGAANYFSQKYGLQKHFVSVILRKTGIDDTERAASISGTKLKELDRFVHSCTMLVSGTGGYGNAMVTSGGVSLDEVDLKTLESRKLPGVYFIGECLDVNGDTGGFNLQFAYSSGRCCADSINK